MRITFILLEVIGLAVELALEQNVKGHVVLGVEEQAVDEHAAEARVVSLPLVDVEEQVLVGAALDELVEQPIVAHERARNLASTRIVIGVGVVAARVGEQRPEQALELARGHEVREERKGERFLAE